MKRKEIYRLHIGHIPRKSFSLFEGHKPSHAYVHAGTHHADHTVHKNHGFAAFVWDKLQFILVSAAVFAIIYVILNWQALAINAVHYWNKWHGIKSPLLSFTETVRDAPEKLPAPATESFLTGNTAYEIPSLAIEVYPSDIRLIIPRINQNVPIVGVKNENLIERKWDQLESDIQTALRNGVIHYPGTALPGDNGNVVLTGHSSYYAWDAGRFKDVFALLHDVRIGYKIVVYFNQKKFIYEAFNIKIVYPRDVNVLAPTSEEQLTLITCTPIGTNLKRLIVEARLISKE